MDKHDESAADRRRTQIRMAQRAYRQRKESTLEELRTRVSELTHTVELMNKAFTDHCHRLVLLGLPSRHLQDVHETAEHFDTLMKGMRIPREYCFDDLLARSQRESTSSGHGVSAEQHQTTMEPRNVPAWIDRSAIWEQQQPKPQDPASVGLGYTLYMPEPEEMEDVEQECFAPFDPTSTALTSPSSPDLPQQPQPQPQQRQSFELFPQEIPQYPSIPASPTPPRTYSFQETTFGRRLHRAALEQGYQLLLHPQRRPATYDRVFRLSLMSRSREKVLAHMKMMLERGPHESLDQDTPLIHVGGAGTHYPRRRAFGRFSSSSVPQQQQQQQEEKKGSCWHMGIIGPQNLALLENAAKENIAVDMTVEIAGFQGEWFDPYDVEGYLEEKGIVLDPASSFAAVEVLLPLSRHASGSRTPHSSSSYVAQDGGIFKTPSSNSVQQHQHPTSPPVAPRPFDREQLFHLHSMGIDASAYESATTSTLTTTTTTVTTSSPGPCSSTVRVSDPSSLTGTRSWMHFFPQPGEGEGEGEGMMMMMMRMRMMRTHMPPLLDSTIPDQDVAAAAAGVPLTLPWEVEGFKATEEFVQGSSSRAGMDDGSATGMKMEIDRGGDRGGGGGEATQWTKKTIIIDVAKFVKILIVSGVCLSRTPGYTRRDVDRALALASFDAF